MVIKNYYLPNYIKVIKSRCYLYIYLDENYIKILINHSNNLRITITVHLTLNCNYYHNYLFLFLIISSFINYFHLENKISLNHYGNCSSYYYLYLINKS